jgi:hypothetical protein
MGGLSAHVNLHVATQTAGTREGAKVVSPHEAKDDNLLIREGNVLSRRSPSHGCFEHFAE